MFGFLIGTACLVGLFFVVRRGRRFGNCGGHHSRRFHGYGCHGHGPPPWWGHHRVNSPGRAALWELLSRLDTSPGQEKVIRAELDAIREELFGMRRELEQSASDLGRAMRAESFDETAMGELFARHDEVLRQLRLRTVGAFARIHDALDESQRKQLADLLESGPGFGVLRGRGGPYRSWA